MLILLLMEIPAMELCVILQHLPKEMQEGAKEVLKSFTQLKHPNIIELLVYCCVVCPLITFFFNNMNCHSNIDQLPSE